MKKNYISVLFLISILSCSSGNPVAPNTSSLTNLAKTPSSTPDKPIIKRINLNGRVINSITNKSVENADILIYSIINEDIYKALKDNTSLKSLEDAKTTEPTSSVSPSPSPTISSEPIPIINSPIPSILPSPNPSISIPPIKENEEEIKKEEKADEKKALDLNLINALSKIKPSDIEEFKSKTGNDGKFWINNIPENNIIITINAKGYKSLSVFSLDTSKVEDILLEPINIDDKISSFEGKIVSALDNPVENATVGHSFYISEFYGIPSNSDNEGKFKIDSCLIGERLFVASTKDEIGKVISLGINNFDVKKIDKKKEEEIKNKNKENTEKKEEENIIKLKAVTKYINFKGKLELSKTDKLKNINVYIAFKKKGNPREEVFLTEYIMNENSETFDLSLPELEDGYYYHLEFVSSDKEGNLVYHHENNLRKEQQDMKISFIKPITNIASDFIKNAANEKLPIFIWSPVDGISFYRISISKIDEEENISTIWSGITPFNTAIYPISIKNDKNKYIWTVTGIKENNEKNTYDKLSFSKLSIDTWSDLTNSISQEIILPESDIEMQEIDNKDDKKNN